jgi:hypothetical protein
MIYFKKFDYVNKDNEIYNYLSNNFLVQGLWYVDEQALKSNPTALKEVEDAIIKMKNMAESIQTMCFCYGVFKADLLDNILSITDDEITATTLTKDININNNQVAIQLVTLGEKAVHISQALNADDAFTDYFYWHGFCSALTEALAKYVHDLLQKDFPQFNKRISWGYPALPNLIDQNNIVKLFPLEKIRLKITESGMLVPEYSTMALCL